MKGAGDYVSPNVFPLGIEQCEGLGTFSNMPKHEAREMWATSTRITRHNSPKSMIKLRKPFDGVANCWFHPKHINNTREDPLKKA